MPDPSEFVNRIAVEIYDAAVNASAPANLVRKAWPQALDHANRISLIAVGKAAAAMANEATSRLDSTIIAGVVVCPPGLADTVNTLGGRVRVFLADHPVPTPRNLPATSAIKALAGQLTEIDQALVLISGGASAYLCCPAPGLKLQDLRMISEGLLRSGAPIEEINTVRKHLETLKGGGLARLLCTATSQVLVLSDVIGDSLAVIGSGPMTDDPTSFADALEILTRHGLADLCPAVTAHLKRGIDTERSNPHSPAEISKVFGRVHSSVIGNNSVAVEGVCDRLRSLGFEIAQSHCGVTGDAAATGRDLVNQLREGGDGNRAIVWGGEITVNAASSSGLGGPCQELALAAATDLTGCSRMGVVALSTDGIDGPTDAAGGWAVPDSCAQMRELGIDPVSALKSHDSYSALNAVGGLLKGGPTGTNLNDVFVGVSWQEG